MHTFLNNHQLQTYYLLTQYTCPFAVWRIHDSIYDIEGTVVVAPCEDEAIEHYCVTVDCNSDQEWFDEIMQDYKDDGYSDEESWDRASKGFYFVNGADPIDISDWNIRRVEKSTVHNIKELLKLDHDLSVNLDLTDVEQDNIKKKIVHILDTIRPA